MPTISTLYLRVAVGYILVDARASANQMRAEVDRLEALHARLGLLQEQGRGMAGADEAVFHGDADEEEFNGAHGEAAECLRRFKNAVAQLYALTGDEIRSG